jgi:transcriptional regulator with XRE-family HTH domain
MTVSEGQPEGGSMARNRVRVETPRTEEVRGVTDQLKEAIRRSGESLNHLGRRAGVDDGSLSRFIRGERDLTLATADRLCKALGLKLVAGEGASGTASTPEDRGNKRRGTHE